MYLQFGAHRKFVSSCMRLCTSRTFYRLCMAYLWRPCPVCRMRYETAATQTDRYANKILYLQRYAFVPALSVYIVWRAWRPTAHESAKLVISCHRRRRTTAYKPANTLALSRHCLTQPHWQNVTRRQPIVAPCASRTNSCMAAVLPLTPEHCRSSMMA